MDVLEAIERREKAIQMANEEDLAWYWRVRNDLDKNSRFKFRKIIWTELESRYENLSRKPITLNFPYFQQFDAKKLMKLMKDKIDQQNWPSYVKAWHKSHMKIVTSTPRTIAEILTNVQRPAMHGKECVCKQIKNNLKQRGWKGELPKTEGHVLFLGREYDGPNREVLNVCATNVPQQSKYDLKWEWKRFMRNMPSYIRLKTEDLQKCMISGKWYRTDFAKTWMAYQLRKDLRGSIIGVTDKNVGELWVACPKLYERVWDKLYGEQTGYKNFNFGRWLKKYKHMTYNEIVKDMLDSNKKRKKNMVGNEKDLMQLWHKKYT